MTTPRHVQAWAKVHSVEPFWGCEAHGIRDCQYNCFFLWYCPVAGGAWPVPDANSDAWLAGMVRAVAGSGYGSIRMWKDGDLHKAITSLYDILGRGLTLEDAIINAVLGDEK